MRVHAGVSSEADCQIFGRTAIDVEDIALAVKGYALYGRHDIRTGTRDIGGPESTAGSCRGNVGNNVNTGTCAKRLAVETRGATGTIAVSHSTCLATELVDPVDDVGLRQTSTQRNAYTIYGEYFIRCEGRGLSRSRLSNPSLTRGCNCQRVIASRRIGRCLDEGNVRIGDNAVDARRTVQQLLVRELRVAGDTIDRIQRVGDFRLVGCKSVFIVDTGVSGIKRQTSYFDQQPVDLVQDPFGRLNDGDCFFRVFNSGMETSDLGSLLFRNDQGRGTIRSSIHFQTRRQTLERLRKTA